MVDNIGPWENIKVVGKGGSSTVFKALLKSTSHIAAVKQIDTDGLSKDQILNIKGEIETIKDLSHPNIVSYIGTQQSSNKIFIFLEYADRGSLRQFYQRRGALTEAQVSNCTRQLLRGLQYLHSNGIAHRDIKCANCLLTKQGIVKLADFGASKRFDSESIVSGLKGTPNWMAPEVIKGVQMTAGWMKADVWSVGCTLVEMLTGDLPFSCYDNPMTAMYHIASGECPPIRGVEASEILRSFVQLCCSPDPRDRPSVDELLKHAFVLSPILTIPSHSSPPITIDSDSSPSQTFQLTTQLNQIESLSSPKPNIPLSLPPLSIPPPQPPSISSAPDILSPRSASMARKVKLSSTPFAPSSTYPPSIPLDESLLGLDEDSETEDTEGRDKERKRRSKSECENEKESERLSPEHSAASTLLAHVLSPFQTLGNNPSLYFNHDHSSSVIPIKPALKPLTLQIAPPPCDSSIDPLLERDCFQSRPPPFEDLETPVMGKQRKKPNNTLFPLPNNPTPTNASSSLSQGFNNLSTKKTTSSVSTPKNNSKAIVPEPQSSSQQQPIIIAPDMGSGQPTNTTQYLHIDSGLTEQNPLPYPPSTSPPPHPIIESKFPASLISPPRTPIDRDPSYALLGQQALSLSLADMVSPAPDFGSLDLGFPVPQMENCDFDLMVDAQAYDSEEEDDQQASSLLSEGFQGLLDNAISILHLTQPDQNVLKTSKSNAHLLPVGQFNFNLQFPQRDVEGSTEDLGTALPLPGRCSSPFDLRPSLYPDFDSCYSPSGAYRDVMEDGDAEIEEEDLQRDLPSPAEEVDVEGDGEGEVEECPYADEFGDGEDVEYLQSRDFDQLQVEDAILRPKPADNSPDSSERDRIKIKSFETSEDFDLPQHSFETEDEDIEYGADFEEHEDEEETQQSFEVVSTPSSHCVSDNLVPSVLLSPGAGGQGIEFNFEDLSSQSSAKPKQTNQKTVTLNGKDKEEGRPIAPLSGEMRRHFRSPTRKSKDSEGKDNAQAKSKSGASAGKNRTTSKDSSLKTTSDSLEKGSQNGSATIRKSVQSELSKPLVVGLSTNKSQTKLPTQKEISSTSISSVSTRYPSNSRSSSSAKKRGQSGSRQDECPPLLMSVDPRRPAVSPLRSKSAGPSLLDYGEGDLPFDPSTSSAVSTPLTGGMGGSRLKSQQTQSSSSSNPFSGQLSRVSVTSLPPVKEGNNVKEPVSLFNRSLTNSRSGANLLKRNQPQSSVTNNNQHPSLQPLPHRVGTTGTSNGTGSVSGEVSSSLNLPGRVIQSAPATAVSRSVNLPPISHQVEERVEGGRGRNQNLTSKSAGRRSNVTSEKPKKKTTSTPSSSSSSSMSISTSSASSNSSAKRKNSIVISRQPLLSPLPVSSLPPSVLPFSQPLPLPSSVVTSSSSQTEDEPLPLHLSSSSSSSSLHSSQSSYSSSLSSQSMSLSSAPFPSSTQQEAWPSPSLPSLPLLPLPLDPSSDLGPTHQWVAPSQEFIPLSLPSSSSFSVSLENSHSTSASSILTIQT